MVAEVFLPSELWRTELSQKETPFEYRTLAHLPAAHIAGVQGYFINPFYMGGVVYWMPKFDFAKFLAYNKKYQITFFFTVPPIYLLIAKMPIVTDQFDSLEVAVSGAAPLGKELQVWSFSQPSFEKLSCEEFCQAFFTLRLSRKSPSIHPSIHPS
jgi:hypothetical protein